MSNPENEVIKAVGTDIYQDTLQPFAKHIGNVLGDAGQLIELLSPISGVNYGLKGARDWLKEKLVKDLSCVDKDDLILPNPVRLKNSLEGFYAVCDDETLKLMFAELISGAFQKSHQESAHPSHIAILQQLSPFEANLLKLIVESSLSINSIFNGYLEHKDIDAHYGNYGDPMFGVFIEQLAENKVINNEVSDGELEVAWNNLKRLEIIQVISTTEAHFQNQRAQNNEIIPAHLDYSYNIRIGLSGLGHDLLVSCGVLGRI
ncbi:Abi-alpha family protein [Vibrio sp. Vb1337]|uniref:Abi-alpha family protein n=1 Tax=Vibrio sp. Vb1337 TaxID=3074641 RepID=UPI00296543D5|nr:Abi-alpha family protein [Vibrio sp. Vb1337]MDW1900690.1 Abi-alpha family protein [Vibrio sp. Vb1337]